jgi:hypothetical protein
MKTLVSIAAITVTILTGCSDKKLPEPVAPQTSGVIPQAQLDALNKAKNVEAVLKQDEQKLREQSEAVQ